MSKAADTFFCFVLNSRSFGAVFLWYRIVAAAAPGMAPSDSSERKPEAFKNAIFLKCLQPVLRTGRCVTAGRAQQRRNDPLVYFNNSNEWQGQYFKKGFHLFAVFVFSGLKALCSLIHKWLHRQAALCLHR